MMLFSQPCDYTWKASSLAVKAAWLKFPIILFQYQGNSKQHSQSVFSPTFILSKEVVDLVYAPLLFLKVLSSL